MDDPDVLSFFKIDLNNFRFEKQDEPYSELYNKDVVLMSCVNLNGKNIATLIVAGKDHKNEQTNTLFSQFIDTFYTFFNIGWTKSPATTAIASGPHNAQFD